MFSTKERRPWLDEPLRPSLWAYLGGIARENKGTALIVNGMADHVHLLLAYPPNLPLADLVRLLKTNSSLWLHREHSTTHRLFAWQTGYGAFSVSHSAREAVTEYIARQQEHHRRMSFEEEFKVLLRRHGVEYDERFALG